MDSTDIHQRPHQSNDIRLQVSFFMNPVDISEADLLRLDLGTKRFEHELREIEKTLDEINKKLDYYLSFIESSSSVSEN